MIRIEIVITKFLLDSSKTRKMIRTHQRCFELLYPFLIQVFDLFSIVSGDFEKDKWSLANIMASLIYENVYGIKNIHLIKPQPYSYIALLRFLSHICLNKNDFLTVNFYKSKQTLFLVDKNDILCANDILFDTSFSKIYENDLYPGFHFMSEQERLNASITNNNHYDEYVNILTDDFFVYEDENGKWIGCPIFDEFIRKYLYTKYKEIYELFLLEFKAKKEHLVIPSDTIARLAKHNMSIEQHKEAILLNYKNGLTYLLDLIDLFKEDNT